MSLEAVDNFRSAINQNSALRDRTTLALQSSLADVVALGREHGFEFTQEEVSSKLSGYARNSELSDYELELVSAGAGDGIKKDPGNV